MADKRPAEKEQSVDTFAWCTSCNRPSNNSGSCDKCGKTLSSDNSAICYTSDPKRARVESTPSQVNGTSGSANQVGSATNGRPSGQPSPASSQPAPTPQQNGLVNGTATPMSGPIPVPQALYMNTNNIAGTPTPPAPTVRPQQLYVNVNNQMFPVMPVNSQSGSQAQTQVSQQQTSSIRPQTVSTHLSTGSTMATSQQYINTGPATRSTMARPAGTAVMGSLLNQPGVQRMATPAMAQANAVMGASTMMTRAPTSAPPPYVAPNPSVQQQQQQQVAPAGTPQQPYKVVINVYQIRIGLKRFSASSGVQFKEDGVMFTLREYPGAPLLLNARAILKCRANFGPIMPAMFFYLEASCIKQIRTIFQMKDWEFSDKSTGIDKIRTISVFPSTVNRAEQKQIQDIFLLMKVKFSRRDNILETISNDGVLDIFYGTSGNGPVEGAPPGSQPSATPTPQPSNGTTSSSPANPPTAQAPAAGSYSQQQQHPAQRLRTNPPRNASVSTPSSVVSNQQGRPTISNSIQGNAQPPTLVIPTDMARWRQMQSSLAVGGVYQVQTANGGKKYCVWNGTELVPCMVKDTEVQLRCTHVRVGSLNAPSAGTVKVQNDPTYRGISFSFRSKEGIINISIPQNMFTNCQLCTERVTAMFLYPQPRYVAKIRQLCKMNTQNTDPFYNPASKEERQKHIILFIQEVNKDQKEALLKMRTPEGHQFLQEIPLMRALQILSGIKSNSFVQSKIVDYFGNNQHPGTISTNSQDVDALVREIQGEAAAPRPAQADDDDDDDVIMTSEEVGIKCPYTQQVMKEPVRNKICGHNYEREAIREFINRKKVKGIDAKCPYAGCGNTVPMKFEDLEANAELKEYIKRQQAS